MKKLVVRGSTGEKFEKYGRNMGEISEEYGGNTGVICRK